MPIRDESYHHRIAPQLLRNLHLNDEDDQQASHDPQTQNQQQDQRPEELQREMAQDANIQRLRKGFRLSSMCWD